MRPPTTALFGAPRTTAQRRSPAQHRAERAVLVQCDRCQAKATAFVHGDELSDCRLAYTVGDTPAIAAAFKRWTHHEYRARQHATAANIARADEWHERYLEARKDRRWRHAGCGGVLVAFDIAEAAS